MLLLKVPVPLLVHADDVALPPIEAPEMPAVTPAHTAVSFPAFTVAGWLIVIVTESTARAHPPAGAIVLVNTYTPGTEAARSISPVVVLTNTNPDGVALNVPALAPGANTGAGLLSDWQKAVADEAKLNVATGAVVIVMVAVSILGQGPLVV